MVHMGSGQGRAGQGRAAQGRAGQGRAGQGRAGHLSDAMTSRQVLRPNSDLDRVAQELRRKLLNG